MKILLTGFDPFGGETVNPAFEAVKLLPDTIAGAEIVKQEVPTEFIRAGEVLEAAIQANQPDVVICIGQAGGRSAITPEKVAINLMDGRIADNAGYQPIDVTIQEDGAYGGVQCDRTFVDAVLSGDPSKIRSPYADAVRTMEFVMACNRSMETGLPVKVEHK